MTRADLVRRPWRSIPWLALGLVLVARSAPASTDPRGTPTIELYTMGVGDYWVERFGHSALCVRWPEPRRDRCYNYGTTSFNRPVAMVWNFLRGNSTFWVSTSRPARLLEEYTDLDRTIWVQEIPFAPEVARELAAALAHDARPENRNYRYHHLRDNCTTRLRDFIDRASGGALRRGATGVYPSFREMARQGWAELPALVAFGDLLLGRWVDRAPDAYEAMFLPLVLRDQVAAVFGVEPVVVYARQGPALGQTPPPRLPPLLGLVLLVAFPLVVSLVARRGARAAAWCAVLPLALLGLVVWAVAAVSAVPELRWNELVLVFAPTDLLLVLGPTWLRRRYALARGAELFVVSAARAVGLLQQPLWLAVLAPLVSIAAAWRAARPGPDRPSAPPPEDRPGGDRS